MTMFRVTPLFSIEIQVCSDSYLETKTVNSKTLKLNIFGILDIE